MKWISIKESFPNFEKYKAHAEVLVTDGKKIQIANFSCLYTVDKKGNLKVQGATFNTFCKICLEGDLVKVTHWMPLPNLPKEKEDNI